MPLVVVAMNPVTIEPPVKVLRAPACARLRSLAPTARPGPSGPHSTMMTSRASTHSTSPAMRPRSRRNGANRRVDQISP